MTDLHTAARHYEAALKEAFPSGATGDVFHHWNEARKAVEQNPELVEQPAQRTWVGLTDEAIRDCWSSVQGVTGVSPKIHAFARAIEAKLKEKNT